MGNKAAGGTKDGFRNADFRRRQPSHSGESNWKRSSRYSRFMVRRPSKDMTGRAGWRIDFESIFLFTQALAIAILIQTSLACRIWSSINSD